MINIAKSVLTLMMLFFAGIAFAQTDPGVQSGSRGTGAVLSSVNSNSALLAFFTDLFGRPPDIIDEVAIWRDINVRGIPPSPAH